MKILLIICAIYIITGSPTPYKGVIKGMPFSSKTHITMEEEDIDIIDSSNDKDFQILFTKGDASQILKCRNYLHNIILKRKPLNEEYDLRIGIYFTKDRQKEVFYFDQYQRIIFNGKTYQPTKEELKYIFSFICKPKFIEKLKLKEEVKYWLSSPKCK